MEVGEANTKAYTLDGTMDLRGRPVLASKTGKWKACAFLLAYEAFERMAFYGIASNLVVYLTTQLHEDTVSSVRNVNDWNGIVWMTPVLGAYLADAYLGRYWTFTISSLVYVLCMVLLTMVVSLKSFKPRTCTNNTCNNNDSSSASKIAMFYISLYVIALGAGGTKPNISTFGADQFDDINPQEKQLKVSFFNWWMFCAFLGGLFATVALVYIQENLGWGLGYGIPTVGLVLSLIVFYIGTPIYRHKARNLKSPATDVFRVFIAAMANRKLKIDDQSEFKSTDKQPGNQKSYFRFLDKATIQQDTARSSRPPCTEAQLQKSKQVCGMILIWLVLLIPSTIWAQINTLFVKQGTTLNRHIGKSFQVPAASLGSFVTLSMLLTVPIYDRYFVPLMRARTGNPRGITLLQRLGIGCIIQIVAIAIAYTVEMRRMHVINVEHVIGNKSSLHMSIFWLMPQYALIGVADVFNSIGLLEFFYDQSPDDMQSLGTTFFTSAIGVGNFLNSFLVTMVDRITGRNGGKSWIGNNLNDCHLDYYYLFLFVLAILNMGAFWWASTVYVYKIDRNSVQEEHNYGPVEGNNNNNNKIIVDASLGL